MIRCEFIDTSIREKDIHPDSIFDAERDLAYQFVSGIDQSRGIQPCPVCGTPRDEILFEKWGYRYAICPNSWSVSLATLPEEEKIKDYFNRSDLSRFRASRDYQNVVSKKRRDLWERQIGWMEGRVSRYLGNEKYTVIDWGGKFVGWMEFLDTASFVDKLVIQESLPPISNEPEHEDPVNIICLIDALQRETQPHKLLQRIAHKLKPGGLLIASCRAGSGFDIMTLRENSESVFPLDHIFLPSPQGMQVLLEQAGFEVMELTTPGLMDMKYIKNADEKIPKDQYFLRYIMKIGDDFFLERMQGFLQRNNLSSHLRCVAKRK